MTATRSLKNLLVTGGAGFIGSNLIRYIFSCSEFSGRVINLDKLTYAGNPLNLSDLETQYGSERYVFAHGDICDAPVVDKLFTEYQIDTVIHLAAESHVDRSILGPREFINTNVNGTFTLLEAARKHWSDRSDVLFHHVSTDEVYGSLGESGAFVETTPYDPRSPYSASKASSDHLVRAYQHTYDLPTVITNCSNNYGPYQFPEKLLPLMILNIKDRKPLPVYGDGGNVRDWLYVDDHSSAIWTVVNRAPAGDTFNVGGENEWKNIELVRNLCQIVAKELDQDPKDALDLITFVKDRPGHDRRYAIDCSKIKRELGWTQKHTFEDGLRSTVRWYLENLDWVQSIQTGAYREWIDRNYARR